MARIKDFLSLVKISHTIFSLPFAIIGFMLGMQSIDGECDLFKLVLIILSVLFARNTAMGFNRYADREFDKKNPRTANREIPGNIVRPGAALWFIVINAILFITVTWFINRLCFFLSPVALFVILSYSLTKRFTHLSHFVLGSGLALAPIGAYLAVTARFDLLPVLFSFIVLFWVSGFDILYALQDAEFDRDNRLHSIPAWLGQTRALVVSALLHLITVVLVIVAGIDGNFGAFYWAGGAIFSALLLYEHIIVTPANISRVNLAFATMNGMASVIFAFFLAMDLYL